MFYITGNVLETSMKITTPPRITGEHWTLSGWRALLKFMTRTCTDVWLIHLFTSLFILMLFEGFLDFESCENWYCYVITTWRLTFSFFSENLPGVMPLSLSLKITCCWERQKLCDRSLNALLSIVLNCLKKEKLLKRVAHTNVLTWL